ncbi:AI-2E family transporter [Candidatus Blastococcus massiliensis]|uniref:AI-2E family transporter n=1 Tax=Candidatus Blastococcus massiliensis TaxID=1470358 RepID=UPI0004B1BF1A|nr:AI-2E family transporter [Candidatus Blastococcus massiliensis]
MRIRLPGRTKPAPNATTDAAGTSVSAPDPDEPDQYADGAGVRPGSYTPGTTNLRGQRLQQASRALAGASAQLLLIVLALIVVGYVLGKLWIVLLPVVLGLLFSTVLWPPVRFLRNHGWPSALASISVLLTFFAAFAGIIAWLAPQVIDQVEDLADGVTSGLEQLQEWLAGPPFNIGEEQLGTAIDQVIDSVQGNAQNIAQYAVTGATAIGGIVLNLVLALVLTFFFLKDGPRWVPWLAAQTGPPAAPHIAALSYKTWSTLSEFIRLQAVVGFVDALFIGLGLWALGVPLVLPLAVLTFFGAFIPIIGAFVAGGFAVLIALVDSGPTTALLVLGLIIVVQQIEGNVLQPILQGRGLNLHAAVVILAVTAGSSLAGIIGAFLAVPVTALIAVSYRYARDQLDGKSPEVDSDGTRAQVVEDETGAHLTREQVAPPEDPDEEGSPVRS